MKKLNLFNSIPLENKPLREIYCLVEVPQGSSNKYEYHPVWGAFFLDRTLSGKIYFPFEYGVIPQTWCEEDDNPLDVMVLSSFPTFSGCVISCRVIGLLRLIDSNAQDDKIVTVPVKDPRFGKIHSLKDVSAQLKINITNFWKSYSNFEPKKQIIIQGWAGQKAAWDKIRAAQKCYLTKIKAKT